MYFLQYSKIKKYKTSDIDIFCKKHILLFLSRVLSI